MRNSASPDHATKPALLHLGCEARAVTRAVLSVRVADFAVNGMGAHCSAGASSADPPSTNRSLQKPHLEPVLLRQVVDRDALSHTAQELQLPAVPLLHM